MSAEHSGDARSSSQVEPSGQIPKTTEVATITPHAVTPRQIYGLVAYYMVLLVGSIVLLVYLVSNEEIHVNEERPRLLVSMGFLASGAIIGSILYQIRTLFKYYVKDKDKTFDKRWLSKYVTAPLESVGLALAVMSLIQSGGVMLGGQSFSLSGGKPFAAFGLGALIGFGIREVVGWVGNLTKTMFAPERPG
jgi:hypothetical protein